MKTEKLLDKLSCKGRTWYFANQTIGDEIIFSNKNLSRGFMLSRQNLLRTKTWPKEALLLLWLFQFNESTHFGSHNIFQNEIRNFRC